jgi:glycosyltransferase involved in cell wall biosynthesis
MRSIHIIGSRGLGGAESFFLRLTSALSERSEHDVIALTRPKAAVANHLSERVRHHTAAMRNGWDIASIFAIRAVAKKLAPDIVQTYMGRSTRLTRLPGSSKALHVARLGGYYKIDGYYRHASAWIGNTDALCEYMIREGLPAGRVWKIGNFVDIQQRTPNGKLAKLRHDYDINSNNLVLFSLGRFIEKKGFEDLLDAFSLMPRHINGREVILVIAGDGPLRKELHKRANSMSIRSRLRWVGWQAQTGPFFDLADVAICPSRDEPFGNVILEAWAHSVPIVSTATLGARELIEPDIDGVVVPMRDPQAMASCLKSLLSEGETVWRQFAACGRGTVAKRYSRSEIVQSYESLYESLRTPWI